jgi:hypothetical protein
MGRACIRFGSVNFQFFFFAVDQVKKALNVKNIPKVYFFIFHVPRVSGWIISKYKPTFYKKKVQITIPNYKISVCVDD